MNEWQEATSGHLQLPEILRGLYHGNTMGLTIPALVVVLTQFREKNLSNLKLTSTGCCNLLKYQLPYKCYKANWTQVIIQMASLEVWAPQRNASLGRKLK